MQLLLADRSMAKSLIAYLALRSLSNGLVWLMVMTLCPSAVG